MYDRQSEERMQILLIDSCRAYFNAKTSEVAGENENACALLRRHMYGTRRAAEGWQEEYSTRLCEAGFAQGVASPCVFTH